MSYGPKPVPAIDRILRRVVEDAETGCWLWTGPLTNAGYGQVSVGGHDSRHVYNHRVTYEHFIADIPDGLVLDHLCRNRSCCNPWHLDPVTHRVNLLRGETVTARNAAVTHCPKGHEYTPANTWTNRLGQRTCRECRRLYAQRALAALVANPADPRHGGGNAYKRGCRCQPCRAWQVTDRRSRKEAS